MQRLVHLEVLPAVIIHRFKDGSTWHISSRWDASPKIDNASPSENSITANIKASTKWVFRLPPQKKHILFHLRIYLLLAEVYIIHNK